MFYFRRGTQKSLENITQFKHTNLAYIKCEKPISLLLSSKYNWCTNNKGCLKVYLRSAYFIKTKNFFTENTVDKGNVSWNSTVEPMNSTKKCSETHK